MAYPRLMKANDCDCVIEFEGGNETNGYDAGQYWHCPKHPFTRGTSCLHFRWHPKDCGYQYLGTQESCDVRVRGRNVP